MEKEKTADKKIASKFCTFEELEQYKKAKEDFQAKFDPEHHLFPTPKEYEDFYKKYLRVVRSTGKCEDCGKSLKRQVSDNQIHKVIKIERCDKILYKDTCYVLKTFGISKRCGEVKPYWNNANETFYGDVEKEVFDYDKDDKRYKCVKTEKANFSDSEINHFFPSGRCKDAKEHLAKFRILSTVIEQHSTKNNQIVCPDCKIKRDEAARKKWKKNNPSAQSKYNEKQHGIKESLRSLGIPESKIQGVVNIISKLASSK